MPTDSISFQLEVDKKEIAYLVGLFESYGDFAIVRTIDQNRGLIELIISPDYRDEVCWLLDSLKEEMSIRILSKGIQ